MRNHHSLRIACVLTSIVAVASWGGSNSAHAGPETNPELELVILVFKTHFDIGYTDLASNVVHRYRTAMIDKALDVCDRSRELPSSEQFVWTLPGWPMDQILTDWPGQTEQRRARIKQALKEGRFVVHGLPFTTHTELLEPEELVRGLGFATRVSRANGMPLPRDAKMTDVPCHSWILPTLLRNAGLEFLHLGCNAASRSPRVPLLFWWEGPDGSRLLTMYVAEGYGTGLLPPADWPHRSWLALIHTGDNHGPPRPEEVARLTDELRTKRPGIKVRVGRLSDFADAVLAEHPELPIVRGDMPDTWIHGPMCDPQGASLARTIRPQIATTESLNTLLQLWGVRTPDAAPIIKGAYEHSLLYGEHTWGGALYWVARYDGSNPLLYGDDWRRQRAEGRFERLEASWKEHTAYIEKARDLVRPVLNRQLDLLAKSVDAAGERIVVYNPLPWKRSGLVSVAWPKSKPHSLEAADSDLIIPVQDTDDSIEFVAPEIPAMGYRTFVPTTRNAGPGTLEVVANNATLGGPHFEVVLDPIQGVVTSLVDKQTGRQWVNATVDHAFGQYLYERFDRDQVAAFVKAYVKIDTPWAVNELGKPNLPPAEQVPYRAAVPGPFRIRYEKSAVSVTAVMDSPPSEQVPHAVTTRVSIYRDLPYVDLAVTVRGKAADPWPEAGWMCFPIKMTDPTFRLGRLGSIVDPNVDLVPGTNRNLLALNTGLAVIDGNSNGLGLCALDSPLVSLETPGCWKYQPDFVPRQSNIYVNLFNNQWTTNFRLWNEGEWTSRVRIWSLDGDHTDRDLTVRALEARYPLQAGVGRGVAGPLPSMQPGVSVSRQGVLVTALGSNPDGHGTLLRLWDLAGQEGECVVKIPAPLGSQQVRRAGLRGTLKNEKVDRDGETLRLNIKPFAPTSLIFETASQRNH